MNTSLAILLLATSAAVMPAMAAAAEAPIEPGIQSITVDCQRPLLPSQQAVSRLTGIDNFGQAYAMRARLMSEARRACLRNPGIVRVVVTRPQPGRWLADR
ncbi:MAG TPA: hypothetical protein VIT90_17820 [Lysobacter sp.]